MMPAQRRFRTILPLGVAALVAVTAAAAAGEPHGDRGRHPRELFQRIATYEIIDNNPNATDTDERVAEIVSATEDGMTLVYTDSEGENVGFLDITDPAHPVGGGIVPVGGEPTSVAVAGDYALAAVNTSADYVNVSGDLAVIDVNSHDIVRTIPLGGQPDSVAVSPDRRYAAIAIENERDEDLNDGELPQLPAGYLVIVDLKGTPDQWTTRTVDLTGLADYAPEDPEPEFVDINKRNVATMTLQENNYVVLVDLRRGRVIRDFSAGTVTLVDIDTEDNGLIELKDTQEDRPREPDAIGWIGNAWVATADEGDLFGGTRGFTIFSRNGAVKFTSGEDVDYTAVRLGHYPEGRSDNKGTEPEGLEYGKFGSDKLLFVGTERAGLVLVYDVKNIKHPKLVQALPTEIGPEGLLAIPQRGLFVAACEVDIPADDPGKKAGFRSAVSIFQLKDGPASYPTILSANRPAETAPQQQGGGTGDAHAGLPIPWAALSALAGDLEDADTLYTAHDSFFVDPRLYTVNVSQTPAVITGEIVLSGLLEDEKLDIEGLAQRPGGGFWAASEGAGSVDDSKRPVTTLDTLYRLSPTGEILERVQLPDAVNDLQRRFGFEGVAVTGSGADETVFVAFQREWKDDPDGMVRIGVYTPADENWRFFYYPLDPKSPEYTNAWVGLSEIVALGDDRFAVIERDNLVGEEAENKRIYTFSIAGLEPQPQGGVFPVLSKTLAHDLLPDLQAPHGEVLDKPEGFTVAADGQVYVVTDNDGVDDSPGETQFLRLGDRSSVLGN